MKIRNALVIPAMLALGAAAMPAAADVSVDVRFGGPPPRYQQVSAPRANLAWVPGYWTVHHGRHYWHEGYWVQVQPERYHYYGPGNWRGGRGEYRGDRRHGSQLGRDRDYAGRDDDRDGDGRRFPR
jgi:hypothetical protein